MTRRFVEKYRQYPIHQSPLYKLANKRKLAILLNCTLPELVRLSRATDRYRVFPINNGTLKERQVECPSYGLKRIHVRLLTLLRRIETPNYLHSGIKGRSYISNAEQHRGNRGLLKIDIKKFYPSTSKRQVFSFYRKRLNCSADIAGLLADLTTYRSHLPTGSPLSQHLAFLTHQPMFDAINKIATSHNLVMTCYVDDITVSGARAPRRVLNLIKSVIRNHGLEYHKVRRITGDKPKVVTGVVVHGDAIALPNRRHRSIHNDFLAAEMETDRIAQADILKRLAGRLNAAVQLDARYTSKAKAVQNRLREVAPFA